jgi:hypothetical protein
VEALAAGQAFTFQLFFENLEPWELGLLLYSLELEPGLAHKLGMAKAWGFGSVQLAVEHIGRYQAAGTLEDITPEKGDLRNEGFTWLQEQAQRSPWHDIPRVSQLRKLLRYQEDLHISVRYPVLKLDNPAAGEVPGYMELRARGYRPEEQLKIPWSPWYPPPADTAA